MTGATQDLAPRISKKAHHLKLMRSQDDLEVMKRIWGMPTMEIHGVVGGYQGPGVKSIVPPRAEVKASFRLVPAQDPKKIQQQLKAAVKQLNPDVEIHLRLVRLRFAPC